MRVLLPKRFPKPKRLRVLFVLPVEPGLEDSYGDGLLACRELDVQNRFGLVVVAPSFAQLPWYADHATDPGIRQESHVLKTVTPLVEHRYPHAASDRLLVGFSKSGWGALSLLLRHPDAFGAAYAWDAPLMQARPDSFGMAPIFGNSETFEHYRITRLLSQRAPLLRKTKRLGLAGHRNFRDHMQQAHKLMERLGILHDYADGPRLEHRWDSGWLGPAVASLCKMPMPGRPLPL